MNTIGSLQIDLDVESYFQNTLYAWKLVFILAAVMYLVSGTFFLIFGSTKTQSWNTYWKTDDEENKS